MKKRTTLRLLLYLSCLITSGYVQAQLFDGLYTSNRAGLMGSFLNPAEIVHTPNRFEFLPVAGNINFANNYLRLKDHSFLGKDLFSRYNNLEDFSARFFSVSDQFSEDIHLNGSFSLSLLSASISLGKRHALAISNQYRANLTMRNIHSDFLNYFLFDEGAPLSSLQATVMNDFQVHTVAWAEHALTYGIKIIDDYEHHLKVGVKGKLLIPLSAWYIYSNEAHFTVNDQRQLSISSTQFEYGYTPSIASGMENVWNKLFEHYGSPSFGGDVGIIYEHRKNYKKHRFWQKSQRPNQYITRRDIPLYKWKLGLSLKDFGTLRFNRSSGSKNYEADIENWNVKENNIRSFTELDRIFQQDFEEVSNGPSQFEFVLPWSLGLQFDYHFGHGFYVHLNGHIYPEGRGQYQLGHLYDAQITTRWEWSWLGVYVPVSVSDLRGIDAGLSLRAGPFFWGSGNILSHLFGQKVQSLKVHTGLLIPISYGRKEYDRMLSFEARWSVQEKKIRQQSNQIGDIKKELSRKKSDNRLLNVSIEKKKDEYEDLQKILKGSKQDKIRIAEKLDNLKRRLNLVEKQQEICKEKNKELAREEERLQKSNQKLTEEIRRRQAEELDMGNKEAGYSYQERLDSLGRVNLELSKEIQILKKRLRRKNKQNLDEIARLNFESNTSIIENSTDIDQVEKYFRSNSDKRILAKVYMGSGEDQNRKLKNNRLNKIKNVLKGRGIDTNRIEVKVERKMNPKAVVIIYAVSK